jgi:hypothetical protein
MELLAGIAGSVEDFCERVRSGLADATFEQRRKLVELLIDRVIVTGEEVEIRYVIPTSPESEHVRFCHLRSDYLHHPALRGAQRDRFALLRDLREQAALFQALAGGPRVLAAVEVHARLLGQPSEGLGHGVQGLGQQRRVVAVGPR